MSVLRITGYDYEDLGRHLFRPDRDEYGAVVLAGSDNEKTPSVFFAREVHLLDDTEFTPGEFGYRQIAPHVLARLGNRAAELRLSLFTCHSHPSATDRNRLSKPDLDAHRRVFPHLLDIVDGGAVGGIAFGLESAAGEVWMQGSDPRDLDEVSVIGSSIKRLRPEPLRREEADLRFDRQARMFGAAGQARLRESTVAVIGLGGGGSMVIEQLAHLGVGRLIAVDFDVVKTHNLSRVMGATQNDASEARKKVAVAEELVSRIDPTIDFLAIDGDLADSQVARQVSASDFVFLCTDTITSRLIGNALGHSYFLPLVQIGAKVDLRKEGGIESIYVAVRPVFPGRGCLACAGLIASEALQREAASDEERQAQNYLDLPEVVDPSVVTLNGVAASAATNLMLMSLVGLADNAYLDHRLFNAQTGDWLTLKTSHDPACRWCSQSPKSNFALGSAARLPVRISKSTDGAERPQLDKPSILSRLMRWRRKA